MISQHLSLNMPRLNQNQQIQALTMLPRGDNVSNVSRAFSCHRSTIIWLHQRFQQIGGVADPVDRGLQTLERTGSLCRRTLDVVFQTETRSARQYRISKQCCAASGKPANQFGQGGPMWDKCLQHIIGLPVCNGHNGISVGGDSSGLRLYSLMSLG